MNDPGTAEPVSEAANGAEPKPTNDPAGAHDELLDYFDPRFLSTGRDRGFRANRWSQSMVVGEHGAAPGGWYAASC
jgi:hypothetical protein